MKILIIGAGGVGGYLGARLLQAGADVTFLVRENRKRQMDERGLIVRSPLGDFSGPVRAISGSELEPVYDIVVLATKAYHLNADLLGDLKKVMREGCYILPLLNGMQHMDWLDAAFGREAVFGGLCRISMVLEDDGALRHLGGGDNYVFGKRGDGGGDLLDSLKDLASKSRLDFHVSPDIEQAMWEKFFTLVTFAGATCLMRAPIGCIVSTTEGRAFIFELLNEAVGVAREAGYTSPPSVYHFFGKRLLDPSSQLTSSLLRDIEAGNPIEADHLIGDFYRRGRTFGLPMPLFRLAWVHMESVLNRREMKSAKR